MFYNSLVRRTIKVVISTTARATKKLSLQVLNWKYCKDHSFSQGLGQQRKKKTESKDRVLGTVLGEQAAKACVFLVNIK